MTTQSADTENETAIPGRVDIWAGLFFLVWAVVGWISYLGNAPLRASLFAAADPGPALLPLIVLWLLTVGGLWFLLSGVVRDLRGWGETGLAPLRSHAAPVGFALSLLVVIGAIPVVGFRLPAFGFCLLWLWLLSPGGKGPLGHVINVVFALAAAFALHFLFAGVLGVPLPG